jgi:hypothetical protein
VGNPVQGSFKNSLRGLKASNREVSNASQAVGQSPGPIHYSGSAEEPSTILECTGKAKQRRRFECPTNFSLSLR